MLAALALAGSASRRSCSTGLRHSSSDAPPAPAAVPAVISAVRGHEVPVYLRGLGTVIMTEERDQADAGVLAQPERVAEIEGRDARDHHARGRMRSRPVERVGRTT
jgi:multidrug efflux system membrane fusion protein